MLPTLTDRQALCLTVDGEGRGEPVIGQIAIACTIRNRVFDKRWPDTYREVCLQPWQFSCWNQNDPNYPRLVKFAAKWQKSPPVGVSWDQLLYLMDHIMGGQLTDYTAGCNHYITRALFLSKPPAHLVGRVPDLRIASHYFFRL